MAQRAGYTACKVFAAPRLAPCQVAFFEVGDDLVGDGGVNVIGLGHLKSPSTG